MSFIYNIDSGKVIDGDFSKGKLKRDLFNLKGLWDSLKSLVSNNIASAESRLKAVSMDKQEVDRLFQDIKVIFEATGRLAPRISKTAGRMMGDILDFKENLEKIK